MIKLIASDMDGTLLNSNHKIPQNNIELIKFAQKNGIEFVVATGRAYYEALPALNDENIKCDVISFNGGIIYDKNGNRYSYNVEVDNNENLSNYRVSKSTDDEEVSKVTFTNQLKASIISARVDWEDLENEYGVRPTSVELILERSVDNNNFIAVGEKKVVTSPNWNYTFGVFPRYDAYNREYIYRVRQLNLPRLKNYLGENADSQALKDESGVFVIKNKINTIDIPINIVWDKDILPEKVTLSLTRTGSTPIPTYTKEVSGDKESKTWTTSFNNMVKYDLNGNEYVYTLKILNSDFSIISEENIQGVRTIILK